MRKPQSQPSLATLTEAEREQLADWVRREDYTVVRDRVNQPRPEGFGLHISDKPLRTLWAKVALLDIINSRLPDDRKFTLAEFESLASRDISLLAFSSSAPSASSAVNSSPSNKPEITREIHDTIHDTILNTVHDIAKSGGNTPTQLLFLQRLADFPARVALREQRAENVAAYRRQRLELDHQKFEHKLEMDTFCKDIANQNLEIKKTRLALCEKLTHARIAALQDKSFAAHDRSHHRSHHHSTPFNHQPSPDHPDPAAETLETPESLEPLPPFQPLEPSPPLEPPEPLPPLEPFPADDTLTRLGVKKRWLLPFSFQFRKVIPECARERGITVEQFLRNLVEYNIENDAHLATLPPSSRPQFASDEEVDRAFPGLFSGCDSPDSPISSSYPPVTWPSG